MSELRNSAAEDPTQTPISHNTVFEAVADHYKQDLREFFVRANFYLAVHAALLSVMGIRDAPDTPTTRARQLDVLQTMALRAELARVLDDHANWFAFYRTRFLMLDLFPENQHRFPLTYEDCKGDAV